MTRHRFKVEVEDKHGRWQGILCINDPDLAVRIADTRDSSSSSRVIDENGEVIHEHHADGNSLDAGQSLVGV